MDNFIKENSNQKKPKFINAKIENFLSNGDSINIIVNFLGSCHSASKCYGAGAQYGQYKEVYHICKLQSGKHILALTFSGPTLFDLKKPNIASITKEAKKILSDLIPNIHLLSGSMSKKIDISVEVKGHSRGGIVANNIHKWLSANTNEFKINLGRLSLADPYAGPVNRRIKKANDNFDDKKIPIPENKIVVYTVREKRFRDPAKSLESDVIVFTDVTHDRTKWIAEYVFNINSNKGIYIYADPEQQLNKIYTAVNKQPTEKEQVFINKLNEKKLEQINNSNIEKILNGNEKYKNFAYKKISSDGRRTLFYSALASEFKDKVINFLEKNGYKSLSKKIKKLIGFKEDKNIKIDSHMSKFPGDKNIKIGSHRSKFSGDISKR